MATGRSRENLLTSASGGVTLSYDPALRLYQTAGAATTRFLYDGVDAIAEYNATNALQRRFVFDPTNGQSVLWYEGTGTASTNRRYLSQDERGSVISVSGSTGASLGLNTYDEYGKPGAANIGRYQYTGQKWIGEAGLYDYKYRDYLPHLGIFAQTDPVGQAGGPNLYAYVGNDPVNLVDPFGLDEWVNCVGECLGVEGIDLDIVITGKRIKDHSTLLPETTPEIPAPPLQAEIVIVGKRIPSPIIVTAQNWLPRLPFELFIRIPPIFRPTVEFPGLRNIRPGPGWQWRGPTNKGQWYNPKTGESLRPDFENPAHQPHWDYIDQIGNKWRWYGPGDSELKSITPYSSGPA